MRNTARLFVVPRGHHHRSGWRLPLLDDDVQAVGLKKLKSDCHPVIVIVIVI